MCKMKLGLKSNRPRSAVIRERYGIDKKKIDKIKFASVAPVFAEAISRIYQDVSVSPLFD